MVQDASGGVMESLKKNTVGLSVLVDVCFHVYCGLIFKDIIQQCIFPRSK